MEKAKAKTFIPNTGEIVLSAIKKLMRNTGWTTRTIVKFIKIEYKISGPTISRKISRALKRGVKLGLLHMENGRYRLRKMSRLANQVSARELRKNQGGKRRERNVFIHSRTPSIRAYDYHRC